MRKLMLALALVAVLFGAAHVAPTVHADDFGQWCPDDENC